MRLSIAMTLCTVLLAATTACDTADGPVAPDTSSALDQVAPTDSADPGKDSATTDAAVDVLADQVADAAPTDAADAATDDAATDDATPDTETPDAETPDAETPDAPDGQAPDAVDAEDAAPDSQPEVDAGDVSPDAGKVEKSKVKTTCTGNEDCQNTCVTNAFCEAGACKWTVKPTACVHDIGGGEAECLPVGTNSDKVPCLACVQAGGTTAMSSVTALSTLDSVAGIFLVDVYKAGITWTLSEARSTSGGKSLYFGNPATKTYNNNKQVGGTATLQAMTVPTAVGDLKPQLTFWLWLQTEETTGDDLLRVYVLESGKSTQIWTSDSIGGTTGGTWKRVQADLSAFAGKSIQVMLAFETSDGTLNAFEGAYVDDLGLTTGCCAGVSECDDGNGCTSDACGVGQAGLPVCSHKATSGCCLANKDCDDGKPCTFDLCSGAGLQGQGGGTCSHSAIPNCCIGDGDCDDQSECTIDKCPAAGASCQHINTCCKADSECPSDTADKDYSCVAGQCTFKNLTCASDDDCDDFDPCQQDACLNGKCIHTPSTAPGCCSPQLVVSNFEGGEEGWSSVATCSTGNCDVKGMAWHYKAVGNAKSAPGVLKFGLPTSDTYNVTFPSGTKKIAAASPIFTVVPGKETYFSLSLYGVAGGSSYNIRLYTVVDGTEATFTSLSSFNVTGIWKDYGPFDLTALGGKSIQIFVEVSTSSLTFTGGGLYLDDFKVLSTCLAKKCTSTGNCSASPFGCLAGVCADGQCSYTNNCCASNADCNDSSLCTNDACSPTSKKCTFQAITGCCMGNGDCNDSNACTVDTCSGPGGKCVFTPIPGCCLSSAQCDDKNACTKDACLGNKCVNENTCCKVDKDCDDGEIKCTIDKCAGQTCVHTPTGAAGCCLPNVWVNDFDGGSLQDITISNSAGANKGWQLWGSASVSKSGKGVLYYGDPGMGSFNFGASNGTATTPKIQLPAATKSSLNLSIYMDTELGGEGSYDDLYVYVLVDGQKIKAWSKNAPGFGGSKWMDVKFDLGLYAGKEIQVQFHFDTKDSIGNSGLGVLIDDLKILTDCP